MAETNPQAGDTGPPKGIPALKAHVIANKVDVALWGIRLLTVLFTIGYVIPIFNNPVSAFFKALLANAATSALRLHQRIPAREIALSREFINRFFLEDSAHYLFYSLIFMNVAPNLLILTPIFLFALLHAASYSLTILDTLGQNSMWVARLLISLVEFQSRNILRVAALAEIVLFPLVVIMAFVGYCGLMTPFVYYYFVTWRYASRRNPYTRNTFRELRVLAERTAERPALPAPLRSALGAAVQLVCRMAPPVETVQQ
ncbi:Krueppel homolog 2 isoform X1 [Nymphalis io]|uniref:Krueppel homolog 2 isoform X1 n=1 Tax=Inachis io TaxID=171585 RepID=UPI002168556C|nr:Krueppel homolog 2 isoform X1 [Nymphalis io]XP_050355695.1 Krueppel homolog 2 isoform X2 [Nymphalis io]XP_050355696.1 Krueppel homolog 2 isoform X3 [Nymphalis io]XP_050355697.1 Krueppel homolog 2 isoform X1 [Nymphalis io]